MRKVTNAAHSEVTRWLGRRAAAARAGRPRLAALVALQALLLGGCHSTYVARLAYEQARYLQRAESIEAVIERTDDEQRRGRLAVVLEARRFAARNGLDPGGSYLEVSDTSEAASFHVVTAAYADRLQPYTWWYPIIGRIPYRGYFEREPAEVFAGKLDGQGLDTRIVEASAYSTLGWFDDPLPSALLDNDARRLVGVVLHELVHQNFFVPGQVAFNETLANSIGMRLVVAFFDERGDEARATRARESHRRWLARGRLFDRLAERLRTHFAEARESRLATEVMLASRTRIYAEAQLELVGTGLANSEDPFTAAPLDNASFLALYRYATRAPAIDAFVAEHGAAGALEELRSGLPTGGDPYEALVSSP